MLRRLLLAAAADPVLARQLTRRRLPRRIALRFVAGEHLADGLDAARALAFAGKTTTLDYLGEAVTGEAEARAACAVVLRLLARIGEESLPAGVSVKPTQMGLALPGGWWLCRELLGEIAGAAGAAGAHLTLDMEGSDVTEATVALVEHLRAEGHDDVGCAVQAYLRRSRNDIRRLTAAGASVRLCKGAYLEPRAIAFPSKLQVDRSFDDCAAWLLRHGVRPRLATHDHRLIARARGHAVDAGLPPERYEFQMLYGVRPALQDALVADGLNLRVYVPFGDRWYPYLMRRLAERPANLAFFVRALLRS